MHVVHGDQHGLLTAHGDDPAIGRALRVGRRRVIELRAERVGQGLRARRGERRAGAQHDGTHRFRVEHGLVQDSSPPDSRRGFQHHRAAAAGEAPPDFLAEIAHDLVPADEDRRGQVRLGHVRGFRALDPRDGGEPLHHLESGARAHGGLEAQQRQDERVEGLR